ncbi:bacteriophage Mu I protein GP32 [Glaesserella parasuis]|uniref:phage protease n=1 Tax=Glaesserella parasuis TaxID=738 RepID=UPI000DFC1143|nr:phage protease [Glaesserella parasuis]STO81912.1 bacteriophage Mu I protein GP32 [Glaesserella parasuis]
MIDYEHQTLFIAENGKGNPAAGWIVRAEYISGEAYLLMYVGHLRQSLKLKMGFIAIFTAVLGRCVGYGD